jgi:hypothetical protein
MATFPDLYSSVTQRIIDALEAGTAPWHCPWHGGGVDARPANATTGRPYRGINVLLLNLQAMACSYPLPRYIRLTVGKSDTCVCRREWLIASACRRKEFFDSTEFACAEATQPSSAAPDSTKQ